MRTGLRRTTPRRSRLLPSYVLLPGCYRSLSFNSLCCRYLQTQVAPVQADVAKEATKEATDAQKAIVVLHQRSAELVGYVHQTLQSMKQTVEIADKVAAAAKAKHAANTETAPVAAAADQQETEAALPLQVFGNVSEVCEAVADVAAELDRKYRAVNKHFEAMANPLACGE
jgi:hypothetical protein